MLPQPSLQPRVLQEMLPSPAIPSAPAWMASPASVTCFGAIWDLVTADGREFIPADNELAELGASINDSIEIAVSNILQASVTPGDKDARTPQIYTSDEFWSLSKRIYGIDSRHSFMLNAIKATIQNRRPMKEVLRALIAAAVHGWVLCGGHDSLPPLYHERVGQPDDYRDLVLQCKPPYVYSFGLSIDIVQVSPQLHIQLSRKARQRYAQKLPLESYTSQLLGRLSDIITAFLRENLNSLSPPHAINFYETANKIFHPSN